MKFLGLVLVCFLCLCFIERENFSLSGTETSQQYVAGQHQGVCATPATAPAATLAAAPQKTAFQSRDKYGNLWIHGTPPGVSPPEVFSKATALVQQQSNKQVKQVKQPKKKKKIIKETKTKGTAKPNAAWFLMSGFFNRKAEK